MTDQIKTGQNSVPEAVPSDSETLRLLVQLLLADRQEQAQIRQEQLQARQAKDRQRRIDSEYFIKNKNNVQSICTHRKGGKGVRSVKVDYAVYHHTFTDASTYIRCQICGMKWRSQDTPEFLLRGGQKIPNHTGIGWKDAVKMLSETSNTASASEVQTVAQLPQVAVANLE